MKVIVTKNCNLSIRNLVSVLFKAEYEVLCTRYNPITKATQYLIPFNGRTWIDSRDVVCK